MSLTTVISRVSDMVIHDKVTETNYVCYENCMNHLTVNYVCGKVLSTAIYTYMYLFNMVYTLYEFLGIYIYIALVEGMNIGILI